MRSHPSTASSNAQFDPERLTSDKEIISEIHRYLNSNDFHSAILCAFSLPKTDSYVYHATASVTLNQVQAAINAGSAHGLHDWYPARNEPDGVVKQNEHPEISDIACYISLFDPSKSASNSLKGFQSNSKKGSLRLYIAEHLNSKRYLDSSVTVSKAKKGHVNPYIDFWAWSCRSLEWAGPESNTANVKISHHILPVFMHHFGCVCPSYESLEIIKTLSKGKTVLDIGSGNGYWSFMLRRHGCEVIAVDNKQSEWRTYWIADTTFVDGIRFVQKRLGSGKDDVLLLVYPVVGLGFTTGVLNAFKGNIICIAGTQNGNGYTGFKDETIDIWMAREKTEYQKIVQIPLPSFAGKDDALFVFRKGDDTD